MSFSRSFPAATWLWRRITSRPARLFYLGVLVIAAVPAIALRVEAALFEWRVHKVMSALSSLRIGATPKAEVLSRMAGFKVNEHSRNKSDCDADECLRIEVSSPELSDWALRKAGWSGHGKVYLVLSLWGFRLRSLGAYVNLNSGKVSSLGYILILSTPHSAYPGALVVNVNSARSARHHAGSGYIADESPNYQVSHYWKWPALGTGVTFTRDAPPELVIHAFNLRLRCVWSGAGCLTANQVLPEAEQDRLKIERAANDRMKGPNQCPDWILPGRARDAEDILVAEVKNSGPAFVANDDGSHYRRVNFRLLRVLKGKPGRPADNVVVGPWMGAIAHNSVFDLLNPGQKLLLFLSGSRSIDEPCEAVAATESAMQTVERALGTPKP